MTYSCEVFGFENVQILERIHTGFFLRRITRTKKCTPLYMLYGELGRYPIEIIIKSRMVNFWNRIITGKQEKLSYKLYQAVRYLLPQSSKWICFIRQILSDVGRYDLWLYQNNIQSTKISKDIKQILLEQNYQIWHSELQKSSKGTNYNLFKDSINLEQYFIILPRKSYLPLVKFRTTNHFFPVETDRWQKLEPSECYLCDTNDVCDEYHLLMVCPYFAQHRKFYIKRRYFSRPNVLKFKELMSVTNKTQLLKLSRFVAILLDHFKNNR